ncbi:MAG: serine O-acetyltransferase EpsC [Pseudomonadota bacterium]
MNEETLWKTIQQEAVIESENTPLLAPYLVKKVLKHETLGAALASVLSVQLTTFDITFDSFYSLFLEIIEKYKIADAAAADIFNITSSNSTGPNALAVFLSFRGIQSIQLYRIAHQVWSEGNKVFAILLQNWGAQIYGVDIHPAALIGKRLFVDHAIGIVVGETAVIEDDVSIFHGVTLGSTLQKSGDRHPKIRRGAKLAANATILGNIEIGEGAVIAAGSIVLHSIPAGAVAAGIPAKVIKQRIAND